MDPRLWIDRMILERANLYDALLGLDEATLTTRPLCGAWTAKDVLAHMTGWDRLAAAQHLPALLTGQIAGAFDVETDTYNAEQVARRQALPFATVLAEAEEAFAALVQSLDELPPADLALARPLGRAEISLAGYTRTLAEHNLEHAEGIVTWRKEAEPAAAGPRGLLATAIRSARWAVERLVGRLPAAARDTAPICGPWTAKDVVGHLADWMLLMAEAAAQAPTRGALPPLPASDEALDAWNAEHVAGRREQPWEVVWAAYDRACHSALSAIEALADEGLARRYPGAMPPTPYQWLAISGHDIEHARQMVAWLERT
jgi:uncharacterized protein (TIGR03083 family)